MLWYRAFAHQPAAYEGSTPLTMLGKGQLRRVQYVQRRVVHDRKVQHQLPQLVDDRLAESRAFQVYENERHPAEAVGKRCRVQGVQKVLLTSSQPQGEVAGTSGL